MAMGKPRSDEVGIKKGPWTPEEDNILVSYVQQQGPRNWRSVPINTGLTRCSKSCRLRWTNYLRPGIKHGNFTPQEERMIIHLQALLGNRWAAIAAYLPQRTDNDIKNYWNTHLKKRIKKYNTADDCHMISPDSATSCHFGLASRDYCADARIPEITHLPTHPRFFPTSSTYVSSIENISRLLKGWMCPTTDSNATTSSTGTTNATTPVKPAEENITHIRNHDNGSCSIALSPQEHLDSLFSFDNLDVSESSSTDIADQAKRKFEGSQAPLSPFETWFLDEATGEMEDLMEQWKQQN